MLYGWLEVGTSNVPVFMMQDNKDIILRTTNSNNKIIIGNQKDNISNAAFYIYDNNVGINKVPNSNIQLDIYGHGVIDGIFDICNTSESSNLSASLFNSNSSLHISINNIDKLYFTPSNGIQIRDDVYNTSSFFAPAFNVTSDSNLKRNIINSSLSDDLNIVSNIGIYDYRFYNSTQRTKGFIAQQVEAIFPQCISKTMGFIPCSITSSFISFDGIIKRNTLPFEIDVGERIIIESNLEKAEYLVYKMNGDNIHISGNKKFMGLNVSIVGKFGFIRTIDTNQILALSINSIKAINDKLFDIEKQIIELKLHMHNDTTNITDKLDL